MATTTAQANISALLAQLVGDYSGLGARLKPLTHSVACALSGVHLRMHYPAFQGGGPTVYDLAKSIRHFITPFALPWSEREKVMKLYGTISGEEFRVRCSMLDQKALKTFIKAHEVTNRTGEAGELLLFLLTEWYLRAPQVIAKMGLKTNPQMPVHGSDGVHISYDDDAGSLIFYFGESKIHADLNDALTSASNSIAKAVSPSEIDYELDLVERYIPLSGLSAAGQEAILSYLHPFYPDSNKKKWIITSLIAFNYDGYDELAEVDPAKREAEFFGSLTSELTDIAPRVAKSLSNAGLAHQEVELFLLPLPSVKDFRDFFQSEIGWGK